MWRRLWASSRTDLLRSSLVESRLTYSSPCLCVLHKDQAHHPSDVPQRDPRGTAGSQLVWLSQCTRFHPVHSTGQASGWGKARERWWGLCWPPRGPTFCRYCLFPPSWSSLVCFAPGRSVPFLTRGRSGAPHVRFSPAGNLPTRPRCWFYFAFLEFPNEGQCLHTTFASCAGKQCQGCSGIWGL